MFSTTDAADYWKFFKTQVLPTNKKGTQGNRMAKIIFGMGVALTTVTAIEIVMLDLKPGDMAFPIGNAYNGFFLGIGWILTTAILWWIGPKWSIAATSVSAITLVILKMASPIRPEIIHHAGSAVFGGAQVHAILPLFIFLMNPNVFEEWRRSEAFRQAS